MYYRVAPVDDDLLLHSMSTCNYEWAIAGGGGQSERTGVCHGRLRFGGLAAGSLRVHLAALRAFSAPTAGPLRRLHLGPDAAAADPDWQRRLHATLREQAPPWARPLLDTTVLTTPPA